MPNRPSFILFFFKSADIPPGARWITVHPHGDGKGQPVLVQPVEHGSSTMHVIGGAGGKLNYLKLTGVKSAGDYAKESAERGKQRRIAAATQRKQDAELGLTGIKKEVRADIAVKKRAAEHDFISTVPASTMPKKHKPMYWKSRVCWMPISRRALPTICARYRHGLFWRQSARMIHRAQNWSITLLPVRLMSSTPCHCDMADSMDNYHLQHYQALSVSALGDAQKVLGHALGKMEANAALVMASQEKPRDTVEVSLGNIPLDSAINQLHAIGLQAGNYALQKACSNHFVTITASGMDSLAQPVDAAGVERRAEEQYRFA